MVTRRHFVCNPVLVNRYNFRTNTVYLTQSVNEAREALASGQPISQARQLLVSPEFEEFETEKVSTFEVGYKTLIGNRLFIDAYYYYSAYQDFIAEIDFTQAVDLTDTNTRDGYSPVPGFDPDSDAGKDAIINNNVSGGRLQRYGFDVNADGTVESQGAALELKYVFGNGYSIGGNVAWNDLISQQDLIDQGFRASYNTPEWRYNIRLENRKVTPNLGFNVVYRWQDAFLWESSFGSGIVDTFNTLDAQVSYKIPQLKTTVKLSGSNLLNDYYVNSFGNPSLGGIYLVTFKFDQFLN